MMFFIKLAIVLILLAIIASLGSGLFFLLKDRSDSKRTVKALTVRIALSFGLFLILLILIFTGVIHPNTPFH